MVEEIPKEEDFKYRIPDEYWEHVHKWYADNLKADPVDTERHINFRVQDATLISSREEVENQHKAWHDRQKTKFVIMLPNFVDPEILKDFKIKSQFEFYLHKSLSKKVYVLTI